MIHPHLNPLPSRERKIKECVFHREREIKEWGFKGNKRKERLNEI